jgi:hypothetical protein
LSENETQTEPRKRPRQPRHDDPAKILFVGGTGRSGTHIVSRVLVRNPEYALVPVECRFHVEENGFPGLLSGAVSKDQFIRRMRGFWWKGFQTNRMRGLHKFVDPVVFDTALERFGDTFDDEPSEACRNVFYDLLWHRAERKNAVGIIEQSCDVIAAAGTLAPLFPEARFIHIVRDGRDVTASLVRKRSSPEGGTWATFESAHKIWLEHVGVGRKFGAGLPAGQYLEIRYEDLVKDDLAMARRVFGFLKLEVTESVAAFCRQQAVERTPFSGPTRSLASGQFERSEWQQVFSGEEQRKSLDLLGPMLRELGYPVTELESSR